MIGIGLYMVIMYYVFIIMFVIVMLMLGGVGGVEYIFILLFGMLFGLVKFLMVFVLWWIIIYYSCIVFGVGVLLIKDIVLKKIKLCIKVFVKVLVKNIL